MNVKYHTSITYAYLLDVFKNHNLGPVNCMSEAP